MSEQRVVYLVAAAAPPVRQLAEPLGLLRESGWSACVVLTPTAASWVDVAALEADSGFPVRVHPRLPHEQDPLPPADAVLAAPMTFNTINKVAGGISDTLAASLLNELLGVGLPMVFAPCVKQSLRQHPAYKTNVALLDNCGVRFMDPEVTTSRGPDGLAVFNWKTIVSSLVS